MFSKIQFQQIFDTITSCLDFCMMMNALLEVLLARQLLYFSFKFHHPLLMIYILHLQNEGKKEKISGIGEKILLLFK